MATTVPDRSTAPPSGASLPNARCVRVMRDLAEERIRVSEAATLIGLGRRQVLRLAKALRQRGPAALASRRRGKPSNRSYPGVLRTEVTGIIRERYADFGPTLAGEKLAELHGIRLARETIRQWMMVAGLWKQCSALSRQSTCGPDSVGSIGCLAHRWLTCSRTSGARRGCLSGIGSEPPLPLVRPSGPNLGRGHRMRTSGTMRASRMRAASDKRSS